MTYYIEPSEAAAYCDISLGYSASPRNTSGVLKIHSTFDTGLPYA